MGIFGGDLENVHIGDNKISVLQFLTKKSVTLRHIRYGMSLIKVFFIFVDLIDFP